MMIKNDLTQKYGKSTIWIHWVTTIPLGKYVEELEPVDKLGYLKIHAILGIIVLLLSIYRSYLYFKSPRPPQLNKLVIWIHNIFYFLLFLIPLTGIVTMITTGYGDAISAGDINLIKPHEESLPLESHEILATLMMILLLLHIIGVVKHKVLYKENTMKRIL